MKKITTVELDLAKSVFQVHGIAEEGDVIVRRALPLQISTITEGCG
ncbi:hypothetical protein [Rhizobium sp. BR 315]